MDIYLTTSKTGKLADKRIRIFREENPRPLDDAMDLVFTREEIDNPKDTTFTIYGYNESVTFKTNDERLGDYFNSDPASWTEEAIEKIASEEKVLWEAYFKGEVFGIAVERWNVAEREWTPIDITLYGCYSTEDAIANAKDFLHQHASESIVVTCEEDCKDDFTVKEG